MGQRTGGALEQLRQARPGERFQAYHRAANRAGRSRARNLLLTAAGIAIVAVGLVALPAPGPGMLIIAIGGGLIARQLETVARWLDRGEVALRRLLGRSRAAWKAASLLERGVFLMVVLAGAVVLGYWALYFLLRG